MAGFQATLNKLTSRGLDAGANDYIFLNFDTATQIYIHSIAWGYIPVSAAQRSNFGQGALYVIRNEQFNASFGYGALGLPAELDGMFQDFCFSVSQEGGRFLTFPRPFVLPSGKSVIILTAPIEIVGQPALSTMQSYITVTGDMGDMSQGIKPRPFGQL